MIKLNNNSIIGGTIILMVILITLAAINFPKAVATEANTGGGCCGNNGNNTNSGNGNLYGNNISEYPAISIKELLNKKKNYLGTTVKIEGTITEVCQDMGCWFNVNDGTGTMYIDLEMGKYFTIPKNTAKSHVIVEGILKEKDGKVFITGYGVKIGK